MRRGIARVFDRSGLDSAAVRLAAEARLAVQRISAGRRHPWATAGVDGYPPLPPRRLIFLVSGGVDDDWFLEGGRLAHVAITESLNRNAIDLRDVGSVLDFGCGCGRVIRHWQPVADQVDLYGVDYNASLVNWCHQALPFARFATNWGRPPVAFPDDMFGLVYALSVFTHLPEAAQVQWRDELARIVRPGGHAIITVQGDKYRAALSESERHEYDSGELVVRYGGVLGANQCSAFHPKEYLDTLFNSGIWEIVERREGGALGNPEQDLLLLRRSR